MGVDDAVGRAEAPAGRGSSGCDEPPSCVVPALLSAQGSSIVCELCLVEGSSIGQWPGASKGRRQQIRGDVGRR